MTLLRDSDETELVSFAAREFRQRLRLDDRLEVIGLLMVGKPGLVGKNFMSHPTWQVFGTFDERINAFKGMQMGHVMVQDYYQDRKSVV